MPSVIDFDSLSNSIRHDFSDEQIHKLSSLCHGFPDIDKIWRTVKSIVKTDNYFDMLCDNKDLELQMKNEMMLLIYNSISIYTGRLITGSPKFLDETEINEKRNLIYENKVTFQKVLNQFHLFTKRIPLDYVRTYQMPSKTKMYKLCNIKLIPKLKKTRQRIPGYHYNFFSTQRSSLVVEKTRLSDYIYSHMFITTPPEKFKQIHTFSKDNSKYYYHFNNNSRYFLSILLRTINSGITPYTLDAENGVSLESLNRLFLRLYEGFNVDKIQTNNSEKYLFLYNTEYIFQASFLIKIYKSFHSHFNKRGNEISYLNNFFLYLRILDKCPLNIVKIYMLENNINTLFSLQKLDKPNSNDLFKNTKELCTILISISNILTYCFFKDFYDHRDKDVNKVINPLQTYFSYPQHAQSFKWSYLMQKQQPYELKSFFNEYLDFFLTYVFYSPSGISSSTCFIDNLISGKDIYFNYLLQRK